MKIALIITTGRTGSDFLQHCLDGLKGLIVFSDKFEYHQFFENKNQLKNSNLLLSQFLKKYSYLFSEIKIENIKVNLSIKSFKSHFLKLSKGKLINRKEFLLLLYKSYFLTSGKKLKDAKTIIHHSHGINNLIQTLEDFPNAKLLITIRHPLSNLRSGLINWFKYDKSRISTWHVFYYLYRIRQDLKYLLNLKNKKKFIKIEEANQKKIKKSICRFLSIKFQKNIFKATVLGKPWVGDKLSKRKSREGKFLLPGGEKEISKFYPAKEIKLLNYIYRDYKKFNYKLNRSSNFTFFLNLIHIYSFEKYVLQHKKSKNNFFTNIIHLMYRIVFFFLIFLRLDFLLRKKHVS